MAYTKTVTSAVAVAGTHTLTLSDVDNLYVGDTIHVDGCGQEYDGNHVITAVSTANATVSFVNGNHTQAAAAVSGQLTVRVQWMTEADVETWLGYTAAGAFLTAQTEAANEWAFRKRQEAGYSDRAAFPPNPSAKEGTVLYGALLYRDRGSSGDTYAAYDAMGQFERPVSMSRVLQLLGVGRPQVG